MRFQMWIYSSEQLSGMPTVVVLDTAKELNKSGSVLLRDQSSYPEDNNKLVWKNAAYPTIIVDAVKKNGGYMVAEAHHISMLDANIKHNVLQYLWDIRDGK